MATHVSSRITIINQLVLHIVLSLGPSKQLGENRMHQMSASSTHKLQYDDGQKIRHYVISHHIRSWNS